MAHHSSFSRQKHNNKVMRERKARQHKDDQYHKNILQKQHKIAASTFQDMIEE